MVDAYSEREGSCADPGSLNDVDIPEFVVLACINDIRRAKKAQIQRAAGMSPKTVSRSLSALVDNGLIRTNGVSIDEYVLTFEGIAFFRKASRSRALW